MTRPEIAKKYGLSVGALNKALKQKGLDTLRSKKVTWEWVDDEENKPKIDSGSNETHIEFLSMEEVFPEEAIYSGYEVSINN